MKYKLINIPDYLKEIKRNYINNPDLWYHSITPKDKADKLREEFKGDFSYLWHEHCCKCWKTIDNSVNSAYYDDENKNWICKECFENSIIKK